VPGNMGFFHDDFPVSKGLLAPVTTLLSMILLMALLIIAWLLRRKAPLVSFGLFFFYVAHLLESTIFPLELVFEHRNYLASYGILLALCAGLFRLLHRPQILVAAGTTALLVLSFLTGARASTWGSYEAFYRFVYTAHPYSKRVVTIFANTNAEAGQFQEAFRLLDRFDDAGFSINRLYVMCQRDGFLSDESIHKVAGSLKGIVEHHAVNGLFKLANLGLDDQCVFSSTAWQALLDAVFRLPVSANNKANLMMYRAHFYQREGELENAISTLDEVYELTPDSPIPLFLATEWLIASGDPERARVIYEKASAVVSDSRKNYAEYTDRIDVLLDTSSR
ncbi:MAG: hypothetical protein U9P11_07245, partial [Pseudomonadota bacterium]|nr:hypothetical protein [Pseudomonadota bacterium]